MMRSMFSGITGLRNFQTAMDIVGNNIANVNTIGFKASRVNFQTTLAQTLRSGKFPSERTGGINPMQIGLGSALASIDKVMTQGSFQNTGKKTDLAIQGDGFFILSDGYRKYYTRAGNFDLDMNGTFIQPSTGLKVQGWIAEIDPETGKRYVDTNKPIGDIVISAGMTMNAKKTSEVRYEGNLKADVGLKAFKMTLKDDNNNDHEIRVWFTREGSISGSTDPFSDKQTYIINIDTNNDGVADEYGYVTLDKFGNVVKSGLPKKFSIEDNLVESGSVNASGSPATADVDFSTDYNGAYRLLLVDKATGKKIIWAGDPADPQTIDYQLEDGHSYNWYLYSVEVAGSGTASSDGSFTISSPGISAGNYVVELYDANDGDIIRKVITYSGSGDITIDDANINNGNTYYYSIWKYYDQISGSTTATTDDTLEIDPGTDVGAGKYVLKVFIDGSEITKIVDYTGSGTIAISDDRITNGSTYNWFMIPLSSNSLKIKSGAELTVTTTGKLKFYEADDPTNFYSPDYLNPRYTTSVQIYDSLGNSYNLYVEFLRLGEVDATHKNVWIWRAYLPTGEPITYLDSNGNPLSVLGGAINFDESGRIIDYGSISGSDTASVNWGSGNDVKYIQFDAGANGDGVVKILMDFARITQFAGENSVAATYQDGNALGTLQSFAINEVGEIIGTFSNGKTAVLGKIALANFNNPAGLLSIGNSLYVESPNSGIAQIGEAGTGGRGTLIPGTLEMSNVDLAEEFTKMIIAQRGFQANARVITTSDQILNELVNIKR